MYVLEGKGSVRALLRRSGNRERQEQKSSRIAQGALSVDAESRTAWNEAGPVELTAKEFDLLELLMRNPGRVYSREQLLNLVWGYEYTGDYRTVDVHVRRLREKMESSPASPQYILTKWGVGYYFKPHGT